MPGDHGTDRPGRRRVLTERDVRLAVKERTAELDVRGIAVTPSAIDLAHRLGVILRGLAGEERQIRRSGRPGTTAQPAPASREAPQVGGSSVRESVPTASDARRVACGADHGGVALKDAVAARLRGLGHSVVDHGTNSTDPVDYPDIALAVARSVASGASEFGIMVDGAGIGSCMVANKVPGVRAAMCHDVTTATNAREHNNANVLTLGGGLIGVRLGLEIAETFLSTPFAGGRHERRVAKIDALDVGQRQGSVSGDR
jgi:ribose 5-phosphate isomerase B